MLWDTVKSKVSACIRDSLCICEKPAGLRMKLTDGIITEDCDGKSFISVKEAGKRTLFSELDYVSVFL